MLRELVPHSPGPGSSALRQRHFLGYSFAYGASFLGDQMWFVTLGWTAGQLDSAQQTAAVMAAGSVPRAALLFVGGAAADRIGPMRTSRISQALRLLLLLAAAAGIAVGGNELGLWPLILVALIFGAIDALHTPALGAIAPQLLPVDELPAGQGVLQGLQRLAMVAGAPLGGIAVALGDLSLSLLMIATLCALSWVVLRQIRVPDPERADIHETSLLRDVRAGIASAARDRVTQTILVVMTVLNFGLAGGLNVGVVLLVNERHWNATGLGYLLAAFAIGAALGAFATTAMPRLERPLQGGLLWVAVGATGLSALPHSPNLVAACGLLAACGLCFGPASAILMGTLQAHTDPTHLARVGALTTFASVGLTPIAYASFGAVAGITTIANTYLVFGVVVLLTCGLAAVTTRSRPPVQ